MNLATYKIRLNDKDFKQDNVILAIHCPLEVFYLSAIKSQLKDIPAELRKDYIITECDFYENDNYHVTEEIFSNLEILFSVENFKEFCYKSYAYTAQGFDDEFVVNLTCRFSLVNCGPGESCNDDVTCEEVCDGDDVTCQEVCDGKEI